MARGKSAFRRNSRRGGRQVRQRLRALAMRPVKVVPPADPPAISLTPETSARLRISVQRGTSKVDTWTYGTRSKPTVLEVATNASTASIAISNIAQCIRGFGSIKDDTNLELTVQKVCAWGPIPTPTTKEALPRLVVDTGPPAAGLAVTDRCAPNHRSRMGISLPYTIWFDGTQSHVLAQYGADVDTTVLGIVDVSVTWRLEPS